MARVHQDQAAGLRQLVAGAAPGGLVFVDGARSSGKTTVAIHLGAALRRAGRRVLLLDHSPAASGALDRDSQRYDVILVDGAQEMHPLAQAAGESLVVTVPAAASITDAYRLVRRISHDSARRHFRVLVNKARSEREALEVADNIARAAWRYLSVLVEFGGWFPRSAGTFPSAPSSAAFARLAGIVTHNPAPRQAAAHLSPQALHAH